LLDVEGLPTAKGGPTQWQHSANHLFVSFLQNVPSHTRWAVDSRH
jgi:hypothetical protein